MLITIWANIPSIKSFINSYHHGHVGLSVNVVIYGYIIQLAIDGENCRKSYVTFFGLPYFQTNPHITPKKNRQVRIIAARNQRYLSTTNPPSTSPPGHVLRNASSLRGVDVLQGLQPGRFSAQGHLEMRWWFLGGFPVGKIVPFKRSKGLPQISRYAKPAFFIGKSTISMAMFTVCITPKSSIWVDFPFSWE